MTLASIVFAIAITNGILMAIFIKLVNIERVLKKGEVQIKQDAPEE